MKTEDNNHHEYKYKTDVADAVVLYNVHCKSNPIHQSIVFNGPMEGARLLRSGSHDFFNISELIKTIVKPGMIDEEKALEVFRFCTRHTYSMEIGWGATDMNQFLNSWGYSFCWGLGDVMHLLLEAAGLRVRAPKLNGHSSSEVFIDGEWRVIDAMLRMMVPNRELNGWITGEQLHNENDLSTFVNDKQVKEFKEWWSEYGGGMTYEPQQSSSIMELNLRRQEQMLLTHGRRDEWGMSTSPPSDYSNGDWIFHPIFDTMHLENEIEVCNNLKAEDENLNAVDVNAPSMVEYRLRCPYALLNGCIEVVSEHVPELQFSIDGRKTWCRALQKKTDDGMSWSFAEMLTPGKLERTPNVSEMDLKPVYEILIRLHWTETAVLTSLNFSFLFQFHSLSMPSMQAGDNEWTLINGNFTDDTYVEHCWLDTSDMVISNSTLYEGDDVQIITEIENTSDDDWDDVSFKLVQDGTDLVIHEETIPLIKVGERFPVSSNWKSQLIPDRPGCSEGTVPRYVTTRLLGSWGHGEARQECIVIQCPIPRFSNRLVWCEEKDADTVILRAAVFHMPSEIDGCIAYHQESIFDAEIRVFTREPVNSEEQCICSQSLQGICVGEYGVAEWELKKELIHDTSELFLEAICKPPVQDEYRRLTVVYNLS